MITTPLQSTASKESHHQAPPNITGTAAAVAAYAVRPSTRAAGVGLFATRKLKPGDLLACTVPMKVSRYRSRTSFEVSRGQHAELSHPAPCINHSCDPNIGIRDNERGGFDFFALRNIAPGEELRTHYGMHEWRSTSVNKCQCGSRSLCRGRSLGYAELSDEERAMLNKMGSARHLTDNTDAAGEHLPPRGLAASIAIRDILPLDVPGGNIEGRNRVRMFIDQLVRVIGMNPHGDPVMEYYPIDGSEREGWTAVQLITTSSVTLHLYRAGSAWIDITSCQAFDVKATAEWCRSRLKGAGVEYSTMELV